MAKLPTDKAATNNAAKDDVVGLHDDFTFTLSDLLANDPGSANKNGNLFFGDSAADQHPDAQAAYLAAHGITYDGHGNYTLTSDAKDFNYFVQIGGNGTWSEAHVTVADKPDPMPVDTHHNGALAAEWTFENHTQTNGDEVGIPTGFWNLSQWAADHPGIYGADADTFGFASSMQVHGVDGNCA